MPVFKDAEQLYDCIGAVLDYLRTDETVSVAFRKSGLVIRFKYSDPDSEITLDGSQDPISLILRTVRPHSDGGHDDVGRHRAPVLAGQGEPRRGPYPRHHESQRVPSRPS